MLLVMMMMIGVAEDAKDDDDDVDEKEEEIIAWWESDDMDVTEMIRVADSEAVEVASRSEIFRPVSQRGSWSNFTVGLVGKPSAGKSTFFNAVTSVLTRDGREETSSVQAKVGAFPFTTIEPNVGFGFCSVPSLDVEKRLDGVDVEKIKTRYGRAANCNRLLKIRVKDVAGLVPNAYKGKGHGNAFLNDLLDADVLVHIIDASGTSDTKGNSSGESNQEVGDPCVDITWVCTCLSNHITFSYSNSNTTNTGTSGNSSMDIRERQSEMDSHPTSSTETLQEHVYWVSLYH